MKSDQAAAKPKKKNLIDGPITAAKMATLVEKHQPKTGIGAHSLFMGQVRADEVDGVKVTSITYSAYNALAEKTILEIREEAFVKFDLSCLHVYHSVGEVKVGEMSLLVMVSSAHRAPCFPSLEWIVEACKERLPIWKQENLEDGSHRWIGDKPAF
ncbi:MAG TPA: molybdenum cofactor biosynthesis protein MoaE [Bacteroidetes bacterium]|nr:molybdenum cofactor biosynthesis protein MoaE [Bacteroidota bacterium]